MPAQRPTNPNAVFPIPVKRFIETLKGTPDEIWSRLLLSAHKMESRVPADWHKLLDNYRKQPAHSGK